MSSFTRSPTELPEIIFGDISLGRYIFSPCGNCSEIKRCLCLLTLQIPSPRHDRPWQLHGQCASAFPRYQGVFSAFGKKVPILIPVSTLPLPRVGAGGTPALERRVLTTPSSAWHTPNPPDFCSALQTPSPPDLPGENSRMGDSETS